MTSHEPTLILWDVDHTLVDIGEVSREIFATAFEHVTSKPLQDLADMTGRTDRAIITDTMKLHDVSDPAAKLEEFYAALAEAADELRERMRTVGRRLPGADEAIAALVQDGVVQTVVTGNIKPIAVTKLQVFDLAKHLDFAVGGYGSDGDTRPPLIRQARQRTQRKYGRIFPAHRVVIVGDTPLDVSGAHEVGIRAVGVATGSSTVTELTAAGADAVVPDLTDTSAFVCAVLGRAMAE